MICTLGNFATKLLSGTPVGITKVHGQAQVREIGGQSVLLYPLFHPAAALRTEAVLALLREDFARLPGLVEERLAVSASARGAAPPLAPDLRSASDPPADAGPVPDQLGLFGG